MKAFRLAKPRALDEAVALLPQESGDGSVRLLAGGQDLLTELKEYLAEPDLLVALGGIGGLSGIETSADGGFAIGALTTLDAIASDSTIAEQFPVLSQAAESVASPQIRSVATIGGNLNQRPRCWYYRNEAAPCLKKGGSTCFAKEGRNKYNAILGGGPSYIVHPSDLAPALVALDAEIELSGRSGVRRMRLEDYYLLPKDGRLETETVRAADEILTRIFVPARTQGMRSTYLKFKERASFDFALSAVALVLQLEGDKITDSRLVLGGVAPKPWRARRAELELKDKTFATLDVARVGEFALQGAAPLAENGYKIPLTQGLVTRALRSLLR